MNKNLLQIYKIYNIESFYYLQKLKNNLNIIFKNLINIKCNIRSYKYINIIENDLIFDISDHIIYKLIKNHNFKIINNQQDNKYINLIQIQTLKYEYYFKNNINFHSPLYLKIIDQININNNFHFIFILHPQNNTPIGIRKNSDIENTLFQFNFFG